MSIIRDYNKRILFKKFYCAKCGSKLKRETEEIDLSEEDVNLIENFYRDLNIKCSRPETLKRWIFECPECNTQTTAEEQLIYDTVQKACNKKIIDSDDFKKRKELEEQTNFLKKKHKKYLILSSVFYLIGFSLLLLLLERIVENFLWVLIPAALLSVSSVLFNIANSSKLEQSVLAKICEEKFSLEKYILIERLKRANRNKYISIFAVSCVAIYIAIIALTEFTNFDKTAFAIYVFLDVMLFIRIAIYLTSAIKITKQIKRKEQEND